MALNGGKGRRSRELGEALCDDCSVIVKDKDKGIGCSGCDKWYHIKCVEMDPKFYGAMLKWDAEKTKPSSLHWYCGGCNEGMMKLRTEVKECQSSMEKVVSSLKREWEQWKVDIKGGELRNEMDKTLG